MKFNVLCTANGLVPVGDDSYDSKKRLKVGTVYQAEIRLKRNYEFHKKYFALINCAWEYLPENQTNGFRTVDIFRKWVEIQAGHCDILEFKNGDVMRLPKSISFDSIDNAEFSDLYERVKDVIWGLISRYVDLDEFERNLVNFMR